MAKPKPKSTFKAGYGFWVPISDNDINASHPCNKDSCMLSLAFIAWLVAQYGGSAKRFKVKSTNHGVTFELNGNEYVAVFDTQTARKIYNYDKIYTTTHSKEKARSSVKPFKSRLMIEARRKVPEYPPMSEETKAKLRKLAPRKDRLVHTPKKGIRRELSL